MSRYRRRNELLELLAADGRLQVQRAAQVLAVWAATARRDFDELARPQMLTLIREVDILVADTGIAPADATKLTDAGVKVVTA